MTRVSIIAAEWQSQNCEHLRYEYDLSHDDLVIDIGAYKGEWAREIFERYGCKLICIEPTDSILGFELGQVINKAASTKDGVVQCGGNENQVSEFEDGNREYLCFDINSLLGKYDDIALVKVNIEGAEYELLKHIMSAGLHLRIRNLQVQFHLIDGEPCEEWHEAIQVELSKSHRLMYFYPFCWESWRLT